MLKSMLTLVSNKSLISSQALRCLSLEFQAIMKRVCVRKIEGEERMQISLQFVKNASQPQMGQRPKSRQFNMDRLKTEEIEKTLVRLQCNVSKLFNTKSKKNKTEDVEEYIVPITLSDQHGNTLENELPNCEAWMDGTVLRIEDQIYEVVVNPPTINCLALPKCIMAGFPIQPTIDAEFVDLSYCGITWYRENKSSQENESECAENVVKKFKEDCVWNKIHEGYSYVPNNTDIGCRLKVTCHPRDSMREGATVEEISKVEVSAGPGLCPFENRHQHTLQYADNEHVRVMSYNILADAYADSDFSRNILFPYCPQYALDISYRRHLLLKEIIGYRSDVICLQEVDRKIFQQTLLPGLELQGYEGLIKLKTGQVAEGTATFYRKDKLRLLSQHDVGLIDLLQADSEYQQLLEKICTKEQLKEKVLERTTALQVSVLEHVLDQSKRLLVATTHLYFHPKASHIRLIQTYICMHHIEAILKEYEKKLEPRPAVIFCGDLNANPEDGVNNLLTERHISATHADWFTGGKDEFLEEMELSHNIDLTSACGYPRYTNFVTGFRGCLDYIYVEKTRLETSSIIPMPTHEEVTQYTALPNAVFPSDHLPIICDITWT